MQQTPEDPDERQVLVTACADAMHDLPLRKMPEEVILARDDSESVNVRISTVTPAGSVIFSGEQDNLTAACSDEKRVKGEKCHDRSI